METGIKIFDTTLRDGEQTPGVCLGAREKLEIAQVLAKLRVDIIEAGFPSASPGDFAAVSEIAAQVKGVSIAALARANTQDIDAAKEALRKAENPCIHTFIATSDIHLEYKLKLTREQVLAQAEAAVRYAKKFISDVEFSAEDASRSDWDYLCKIYTAAITAGATVINIPDTVGYSTPSEFGALIRYICDNVPNIDKAIVSAHCHNDLGMAVANSLAAVQNGARQVECTINGIGERAGNTSLEELVMALATRKEYYRATTRIDTRQIYRTSRQVSTLSGIAVPPNKAVVGDNAFAHESGIHQHGVLNNPLTYEIMNPEMVGSRNAIVLGKHSGRHAFEERIQQLGYDLPEEKINVLFKEFKELADRKKVVYDRDIEALVADRQQMTDECYRLLYHQVVSGNQMVATASVRLETDSGMMEEASCGDGPVDALFKAIEKTVGFSVCLKDYQLKAVTSGEDALGEATVWLGHDDKIFIGRGISTDVIEASARAYVNAMNKMIGVCGYLK
ncbi:2-isopropylmalate synthase [Sporomusa sp. KB1]|jgi:2-isopropylmalate synthase|uniref:2-isopropylmalate synthase n=1 Tax=Sporomusa sp. KB1 TaxID=943346 RepID=UPI00119F6317|nr:2-isopropylmalate synthase [Sporomusa sp. KB1]TWH46083.1 2-isopropylmalate synthase [Sporomusa sp. KB1]